MEKLMNASGGSPIKDKPSVHFWVLWALGGMTRLWDLASRTLHHDESLHATYSFHLAEGRGYFHDPMMHGPFQFNFTALLFWLFGDSDFTARLSPALFGIILLGLPWFFRRWIGVTGAWIATFLLTISPSVLYFSRFLREDVFALVWTVLAVLFAFRALESGEKKDRDGFVVSLSFLFCTKEISFIFAGIFFLWLGFTWLKDRADTRARELFLILGGLVAPLSLALWLFALKVDPLNYSAAGAVRILIAGMLLTGLGYFSAKKWGHGKSFLRALGIFYLIFFTLHTCFFTNGKGILSGLSGALGYWLNQQGVRRGNQPLFYYGMIFLLYEYLPVFLSLAYFKKAFKETSNRFIRFLPFWAIASVIFYSIAGEKMPWLTIHVLFPFLILASWGIRGWLKKEPMPSFRSTGAMVLAAIGLFSLVLLTSFILSSEEKSQLDWTRFILQGVGALLLFTFGVWNLRKERKKATFQFLLLAFTICLTIRHAWIVTYRNSDIAYDLLIYTQSTPQVKGVMEELNSLSRKSYGPELCPIAYDNDVSWPFEWYLRRFQKRSFFGATPTPALNGFPIVLGGLDKETQLDSLLPGYQKERLKLRWWFPEEKYRRLYTEGKSWNIFQVVIHGVQSLLNPETGFAFFNWFMDRSLPETLGSTDFLIYRKSGAVSHSELSTSIPDVPVPMEIVFRGLTDPKKIAAVSKDSILVGQGNGVLSKISLSTRKKEDLVQGFTDPFAVAVSKSGWVALLDRGKMAIARLNLKKESLSPLTRQTTGAPFTNISDLLYIRPKDANEEFLLIADRGLGQVIVLDAAGNLVRFLGKRGSSPSDFNDPVSLAWSANDELYVADQGMKKISIFGPDLEYRRMIQVPIERSGGMGNEPVSIAVWKNRVYWNDAPNGHLYSISLLDPSDLRRIARGLSKPRGLTVLGGALYLSEAGTGNILRFRIPE